MKIINMIFEAYKLLFSDGDSNARREECLFLQDPRGG